MLSSMFAALSIVSISLMYVASLSSCFQKNTGKLWSWVEKIIINSYFFLRAIDHGCSIYIGSMFGKVGALMGIIWLVFR